MRGLYLITPDDADTGRLLRRVAAVASFATLLQYRNKAADRVLRRRQLEVLLPLCRGRGIPLLVNDDWELAREVGADGAHLGRDDGALATARARLGPDAILGASSYADPRRAIAAVAAGASYVAFGAFFPSATKPGAPVADLGVLRASSRLGVPRVAIGGITPENAPQLLDAGADLVAVISGVFDAPDPAAAARAYRACFD